MMPKLPSSKIRASRAAAKDSFATKGARAPLTIPTTVFRSCERIVFSRGAATECSHGLAGVLLNCNSRWRVSDPLPPSAALPLTEGENK
jgi:hypothetical protein